MVSRSLMLAAVLSAAVLVPRIAVAHAYAPLVMMSVTLPGGQVQQVTAPESGLAIVKTPDGVEYGVRPTMQDDQGSRTVITVFKMDPATELLGSAEVKLGDAPVALKTAPSFKVAVTRVNKSTT